METLGDVLVQVLWEIHADAIIDFRFGDSYTDTYSKEPVYKLLSR